MFSAKKKRIEELETLNKILEDQITKDGEDLSICKKTIQDCVDRLSVYESGDYKKISTLLRSELGLAKLNIDFTVQRPDEQDQHHYFYGKSQDQIKEMLASAYSIYQTPLFRQVAQYLCNKQGNYTILASRNRDEDILSRGEMAGFAAFVIEFQALAKEHESMTAPQEKFDNKDII